MTGNLKILAKILASKPCLNLGDFSLYDKTTSGAQKLSATMIHV
jgi:hypothetical protein